MGTLHLTVGASEFYPNGTKGESRKQAKADLKPPVCSSPEGRVSIVRWNPKGMRRLCHEEAQASCCTGDEGWSLEAALQGEASNSHKLLWLNGRGGERCGQKARL